ncbi:Tegument protein VP22 [Caprine alphaherpesvirus 1]|uniref:Tegument protein VP22 n=1 Tax=Caprine alphaherpesvirus 1 TaxID=39944 RepID=A0AAF1D1Z0_9ALPH|nr:Tegument protein VP22 [Caprine alphaherpesvirus 1]QBM10852.1 Tegument protein VP22 [Caprine alphaherpesvirus 1]
MARYRRDSGDYGDYDNVFVRENSLYGYEPEPGDDHDYEEIDDAEDYPGVAGGHRRSQSRPRRAPDAAAAQRAGARAAARAPRAAATERAPPRAAAPQPATRSASKGRPAAADPGGPGPGRSRAPPGANAVASGRPLAFSVAPKTPTAPWRGPTPAYNKAIFCEAVAIVAAEYARRAAASVWDADPPKNNERLDRMLKSAAIRILVCEGSGLLAAANDILVLRAQRAAAARGAGAAGQGRVAPK